MFISNGDVFLKKLVDSNHWRVYNINVNDIHFQFGEYVSIDRRREHDGGDAYEYWRKTYSYKASGKG